MGGLPAEKTRQGTGAVAVLGDNDAFFNAAAQNPHGGLGHLPGGLSDGNQADAARCKGMRCQGLPYRCFRPHGGQRLGGDAAHIFIKMFLHMRLSCQKGGGGEFPRRFCCYPGI